MTGHERTTRISDIASTEPLVAFADEPLRVVVRRMAEVGFNPFSRSSIPKRSDVSWA